MDQFMVDVTDMPEVSVGDVVTLIGRDGEETLSVEEISEMAGSFNYEFVCDAVSYTHLKSLIICLNIFLIDYF